MTQAGESIDAELAEIIELLCKEFCEVPKEGKEKSEKWTDKLMKRLKNNKKLAEKGLKFEGRFLIRNVTGKSAAALSRTAVREATYSRLKKMAANSSIFGREKQTGHSISTIAERWRRQVSRPSCRCSRDMQASTMLH